MSEQLKLTLLSPERRLVTDLPVDWVTLPGSEGEIQILSGHAAIVGTLHAGVCSWSVQGGVESGVISAGFFQVSEGQISVLAETLELKSEIDLARARTSQNKAEQALQGADLDEKHFKLYQHKLQKALVRQQFANQKFGD